MNADRYYVKIDRDNGTRTYKGAFPLAHCEREASVWRESFPDYAVEIVPVADAKRDVAMWARATRRDGHSYYPADLVDH